MLNLLFNLKLNYLNILIWGRNMFVVHVCCWCIICSIFCKTKSYFSGDHKVNEVSYKVFSKPKTILNQKELNKKKIKSSKC